jgi:hypothetical protein
MNLIIQLRRFDPVKRGVVVASHLEDLPAIGHPPDPDS